MSGENIRFTRNDKTVRFTEGEKKKGKLDKKSNKILNPVFDAILKLDGDGKKLDSQREIDAMKKLQEIFSFDGSEQLSESEINMLADFKKGEDVIAFLDRKLQELKSKVQVQQEPVKKVTEEPVIENPEPESQTPVVEEKKPEVVVQQPVVEKKAPVQSSARAFNQMIQNLAKKFDKDEWTGKLTNKVKIERGNNLYTIAKNALKAETGVEPTPKQVNDRMAQIVLVNGDKIRDVNNILVGTEILVSSASTGNAGRTGIPVQEPQASGVGEQSTVKVTEPVDTTGFNKEELTGDNVGITKYTKEVGSGEHTKTTTVHEKIINGIKFQADTVENLKAQVEAYNKPSIKKATEGEKDTDYSKETGWDKKAKTDSVPNYFVFKKSAEKDKYQIQYAGEVFSGEDLADVKQRFFKARVEGIKEKITACKGNIGVVQELVNELKTLDTSTPELQALVKDLLLTRNDEVAAYIIKDGKGEFDSTLFEKDEASSKALISMYQEIQTKERRGEKLTEEEHALKDQLRAGLNQRLYKIEADADNAVVEKYMFYDNKGAYYYSESDYGATSAEVLDEFVTKLNAADTDDKKKALFKEYSTTDDKMLAAYLLTRSSNLKAEEADIKNLINKLDLNILTFSLDSLNKLSAESKKALADRIKDIYTNSEKGVVDNMLYLEKAFEMLDSAGIEKADEVKTQILESYFETIPTKDGTKTYKYAGRRMTKEEGVAFFEALTTLDSSKPTQVAMFKAVVDIVKLEDVGLDEFTYPMEYYDFDNDYIAEKYASFIDNMQSAEEALKLIDNVRYQVFVPYNKILAKFGDNADVRAKLITNTQGYSQISDENRLSLIKDYIKTDSEPYTLNKDAIKKPVKISHLINTLPADCKEGEARKVFNAILAALGKDDVDEIVLISKHIKDQAPIHAKLMELVNANSNDLEFLTVVSEEFPDFAVKVIKADIFKDLPEKRQEIVSYVIKGGSVSEELFNTLRNNGWLTFDNLSNKTYSAGDSNTRYYVSIKEGVAKFEKVNISGIKEGNTIYSKLVGPGSGGAGEWLKTSLNKDNVVGILATFKRKSPKEGLIQYMTNESTDYSTGILSRVPKALMRKAYELNLQNTDAYKNLAEYYEVKGRPKYDENGAIDTKADTFRFTKHSDNNRTYTESVAKELDELIYALLEEITKADV